MGLFCEASGEVGPADPEGEEMCRCRVRLSVWPT